MAHSSYCPQRAIFALHSAALVINCKSLERIGTSDLATILASLAANFASNGASFYFVHISFTCDWQVGGDGVCLCFSVPASTCAETVESWAMRMALL